mmetsp:Transcript_54085/g.136063  ORF Transcript_54085/g.136063 Transcript_54085/m.136063 type:complete len:475 (-) Transcript_54085:104-1528(-)
MPSYALMSHRSNAIHNLALFCVLWCVVVRSGAAECLSCVGGLAAELFLDADDLVVLGQSLRSAGGARLDLARAQADHQVANERVLRLARSVGDHDAPSVLLRDFARLDGLGDGADLVDLEEEGVACLGVEGLLDALDVGDEEVVADDLDLLAEVLGHLGVALKVVLVEGVLYRHHRVLVAELLVHVRQLVAADLLAAVVGRRLEVQVVLLVLGVELGCGDVHADFDLSVVSGVLDGGHEELEALHVVLDVGGEAALVAHVGGVGAVLLLDDVLEAVVHLGPQLHGLLEVLGARRQDHELLHRQLVAGVAAAVDDVHGGHGHDELVGRVARQASDVLVQGDLLGRSTRTTDGHRHCQNGVRSEFGLGPPPFVLGAVELLHHHLVEARLVRRVLALEGGRDDAVDVVDRLEHPLAEQPALVLVAQLQRLVDARRRAGRHCRAEHAVGRGHVHLDGGVAARVKDLSGLDARDLGHPD